MTMFFFFVTSYEEFVSNGSTSGRAWWVAGLGPFHNFPSLPPRGTGTHCALGQMTPRGILQMLTIGMNIHYVYVDSLVHFLIVLYYY